MAAGMDDYISKPVRVEDLISKLERYHGYMAELRLEQDMEDVGNDLAIEPIPKVVSSEWPVDLQAMQQMMGAEAARLVNSILPIFWDETSMLVQALKDAVIIRDAVRIREIAHTIKGSCASLAMNTLADQARQLEEMGRKQSLADIDDRLAVFLQEYEQIKAALADGFLPGE